jgi:hypothetical protein
MLYNYNKKIILNINQLKALDVRTSNLSGDSLILQWEWTQIEKRSLSTVGVHMTNSAKPEKEKTPSILHGSAKFIQIRHKNFT